MWPWKRRSRSAADRARQGKEPVRRENGRIVVSGPVTLDNVGAVLEEGRRHLDG